MAAASVSSRRMNSAVGAPPAHGAVVHGVVADLEQLRMGSHDGHDVAPVIGLRHGPGREEGGAHVVADQEVQDVDPRIEPPTHVEGERHGAPGAGDGVEGLRAAGGHPVAGSTA
jgi:hypothetical protein